jgi:murein DD-endopeptidase MepM/ murein hydrolase activator NlpD
VFVSSSLPVSEPALPGEPAFAGEPSEAAPRSRAASLSPSASAPWSSRALASPRARSSSVLVATATLVAAAAGLVAITGFDSPMPGRATGQHGRHAMAYDRETVQAMTVATNDKRRQQLADFYRSLDQQRASRGEPRAALSDRPSAAFWRPTTGTLTQPFHLGHSGIDIGVPLGTPVLAAAAGTVSFAGDESGYGNHIELRHPDGTVTTYSHLSTIGVAVGQVVVAGQPIAQSGNTGHSTGPHLHFEVKTGGQTFTDPLAWLQARHAW